MIGLFVGPIVLSIAWQLIVVWTRDEEKGVPPRTPINITGIGVLRPLATSGRNILSSKLTGTM